MSSTFYTLIMALNHLCKQSTISYQHVWVVKLHHSSTVKNQDLVIIHNGVKSVCNGQHCGVLKLVTNDFLDETISLKVYISCCLLYTSDAADE